LFDTTIYDVGEGFDEAKLVSECVRDFIDGLVETEEPMD